MTVLWCLLFLAQEALAQQPPPGAVPAARENPVLKKLYEIHPDLEAF
jgi:hypothetical protein